ncbi:Phosphate transport system permease protein PstC (TC 3.A.1.7.1) [invertebrate metagenome]|uniref:Phosphate transport system permease protein PstC (TC 3.A.1.7.1) n=1 Tax=invertebrate metagenome TaxID=1711999 RepID=A0A484H4D6_9ZZZZ
MHVLVLIIVLLLISLLAFGIGQGRALVLSRTVCLHSLPYYYGQFAGLATFLPGLAVILLWSLLEAPLAQRIALDHLLVPSDLAAGEVGLLTAEIRNLAAGHGGRKDPALVAAAWHYMEIRHTGFTVVATIAVSVSLGGLVFAWRRLTPSHQARNSVERVLKTFMILCTALAVLTTVGIILSLLFESFRFFAHVPLTAFLFGLEWSPQLALQDDPVDTLGAFGAVPLFTGTLLVAGIAMLVSIPLGLLTAIYTAEYAASYIRKIAKPILEILAGIPTVVYGFFAALMVAPGLRDAGAMFGISISSESALAAGVVMGIMIVPFVSSLADDIISAVPQSLREGSLGLGATQSETIRRVVLPAALPGLVGGILLAASRAIGETMIVVMAAGLSAQLTANPFAAVTTVTVQIVTLLVGDQEFDSPKTLAAFALGLVLFVVTLVLNAIALQVVRKYREQYE